MGSNGLPGKAAEILFLSAVAHHGRGVWIVLHGRRIPEKNNLAHGRAQAVIGKNVLLHLGRSCVLPAEFPKDFENATQACLRRRAY